MTNSPDIRWEQRFNAYKKALARLAEVVESRPADDLSDLEAEGLTRRFAFTFALAWKTLQGLFWAKGYFDLTEPNLVIKRALLDGLLTDENGWRSSVNARRLTSYAYDEATAESLVEAVYATFFPLFNQLKARLEEEQSNSYVF